MRDQAPPDQVERALARFVVLTNDQQFLARCSIVAWANIAHAAIADVEALNDGEAERARTLNDATTHCADSWHPLTKFQPYARRDPRKFIEGRFKFEESPG